MIRRVLFTRWSDLGHGQHFDRLEELIVRVTTRVALIFFVLLIVAGLASGDSKFFWEALNPATAAIVGGWMLARGSPRAIVQLAAGSGMLALTTGLLEFGSRSGALLGLLSMGIVAALLVRDRVVEFIAIAGLGLFSVAYWWNVGNWSSRQRVVEALIPGLAFVFAAGLIVWLKRELLLEGIRRRRAGKALAASEQQFRMAFETSAAAMALVSVNDGRFLKVNQAGCEMLGYAESDLRAMTIAEVTHPDDREASRARFAAVIGSEVEKSQSTLRYIRSDGSTAYGMVSSALARDAAGKRPTL
jgi:PAS domain S-box-containing protein